MHQTRALKEFDKAFFMHSLEVRVHSVAVHGQVPSVLGVIRRTVVRLLGVVVVYPGRGGADSPSHPRLPAGANPKAAVGSGGHKAMKVCLSLSARR